MSKHVAGWITAALLIGSANAQVVKPPDIEQKRDAGGQDKKQAKKPEDAPVQWVDSQDLQKDADKLDEELYQKWRRERDSRPQRPDESKDARSDQAAPPKPKQDKADHKTDHKTDKKLPQQKLTKQQRKRYKAWLAREKNEREHSEAQQQTRKDRREQLEKVLRDEVRQHRRDARSKHRQNRRQEWQRHREQREAKRNQRD